MKNAVVDWGSSRLFNLVHQNNLVYNTCWEDPRVDRQALELTSDDTVFMITSAGCNALDYALCAPKKIHCVDMNPRQNALLELKQAAIRALDFDTFFALFGTGRLDAFPQLYRTLLRPQLSMGAQAQWDKQLGYFDGKGLRPSFYFRGTAGLFARVMNYYIDASGLRETVQTLFNARSLEEQSRIYHGVREALWNGATRWVMSLDATLSLLGVPRLQRKQVEGAYPGGIAQFMEDCVETVFTRVPTHDNYFWWLYLTGQYTLERCPEYLKPAGFSKLKAGLVDRIQVHTGAIHEVLQAHPDMEITRYVLLDHMDWLSSSNHPVLEKEWQQFVQHSAPRSRFIWRSGGFQTDFVNPVQVKVGREQCRVGELLHYHTEWAKRLGRQDRVHTYGSFYIADMSVN